jgi:membrane protein implicated in regulation of membrane protease activity
MGAFFVSLNAAEKVFFICALVGGLMFIGRMILAFIGGQHHGDFSGDGGGGFELHHDADFDGGHDIGHDAGNEMDNDSDSSFKLLSLQGITAFFMMFGLVGLALSKQGGAATFGAVLGATAAGFFSMWIMAKIFKGMTRLQSDGTLDIRNAVDQEGTVYLKIPAEGEGKIHITIQGSLREMTAVSKYKTEIKTGERIVVDSITAENILVVRKI